MSEASPLRKLLPREKFEQMRAALRSDEAHCLKVALNAMRTAPELPGEYDLDTVIPPVLPAWRRPVDGTNLWIVYRISDNGMVLYLWTLDESDFQDS